MPPHQLPQIPGEVLHTDLMVGAPEPPLQLRPERLNPVGGVAIVVHVLSQRMVDRHIGTTCETIVSGVLVSDHLGQSRYFGRAKTKFQLYLALTVANLTLVAAKAGLPANTGGGSSAGSALRARTIRSALEIVPARLGQILTLALLASASLPKYISLNKAFRPDF